MATESREWQLAFWLITVICGVWLLGLTSSVIANDRVRAEEDGKLSGKIEALLIQNNNAHLEILTKLIRLETIMQK
jgi:hypothetical protein